MYRQGRLMDGYRTNLLPREGLEPTLPCRKRILSPPRLPFRHLGTTSIVNFTKVEVKISIPAYARLVLLGYEGLAGTPQSQCSCKSDLVSDNHYKFPWSYMV